MPRQTYQLTHTDPQKIITNVDFKPTTLTIANPSKFPVYVRIGTTAIPGPRGFDDIIAPYSSYVADAMGSRDFAVFVDNRSDPTTPFTYPVTVIVSTGAASSQAPLSLSYPPAALFSQYMINVLKVANILDLWILNDTIGTTIAATRDINRNGLYVNAPGLGQLLAPDRVFRSPQFNGLDQSANLYSDGLRDLIGGAYPDGTILLWVHLSSIDWASGNAYVFAQLANATATYFITLLKSAPNQAQLIVDGISVNTAVTSTNEWVCLVGTWSFPNNRIRIYLNGVFVTFAAGLTAWANTLGYLTLARQTFGASLHTKGGLAYLGLWNVELAAGDVTIISTIP